MANASTTEIARVVGVSHATVCDVLNDRWRQKRISRVTSQRVLAAARRLNYRPNRLARSLLTGRSHTVALLLPGIVHSFFPRIAAGVEAEAKRHGYHVLISDVVAGLEEEVGEIEALLERRVDGLILYPRYGRPNRDKYRQVLREGFPLVFVAGHFEDVPGSAVVGDDFHGMYRATEHLIGLGHRRIAHLAGIHGPTEVQTRVDGYRAAMRAHGLAVPEGYVPWYAAPDRDAYRNMQRLLALPQRPTAVTAFNDAAALEGIRATLAAGLRVPQDIAFTGYSDDLEDLWIHRIQLTTVRVDAGEMGRRAMARLLAEMHAPGQGKILEKLPAELVIRESCGAKRP